MPAAQAPYADRDTVLLSACPVCGGATDRATLFFESDRAFNSRPFGSRILLCVCGHGYLNPRPTEPVLASFYSEEYHCYDGASGDDQRIARWLVERRMGERFNHVKVTPGGRFLDVGCGIGDMVAAMQRLGMQAEGIEPSAAASAKARDAGLNVRTGVLSDASYPDASFDAVSMFHVLEHTPDPLQVLQECRRILKPDGELIIGVPNLESLVFSIVGKCWVGLQLPTHLHHFTPRSLRRLGDSAGLAASELFTESLPPHVEGEIANWLRRRFFIPGRLSRKGVLKPLARALARRGELAGRGESIVAHFQVGSSARGPG